MPKNLSSLSGRQGLTNNLFERLGELSAETGTPDPRDLEALADEFLIGKANTYGAATFYDFLKPENQGRKVYYCNGTACMTAGTGAYENKPVHTFLDCLAGVFNIDNIVINDTTIGMRCFDNLSRRTQAGNDNRHFVFYTCFHIHHQPIV